MTTRLPCSHLVTVVLTDGETAVIVADVDQLTAATFNADSWISFLLAWRPPIALDDVKAVHISQGCVAGHAHPKRKT